MIDWHSHILPCMDDGSRSVEESLSMLEALAEQGVDTVIATPHFYANEETVDAFLARRRAAYEALTTAAKDCGVRILPGAEVKYYPGISRMEGLERLTVADSGLLLLEMPMARWRDMTIRELTELSNLRGVRIILAHIERYLSQQERGTVERLRESGILMQANASFFDRLAGRSRAFRLLGSGCIQFLGSDCHNMTTRPPALRSAYDRIRKRRGEEFVSQMRRYGYHALEHIT